MSLGQAFGLSYGGVGALEDGNGMLWEKPITQGRGGLTRRYSRAQLQKRIPTRLPVVMFPIFLELCILLVDPAWRAVRVRTECEGSLMGRENGASSMNVEPGSHPIEALVLDV